MLGAFADPVELPSEFLECWVGSRRLLKVPKLSPCLWPIPRLEEEGSLGLVRGARSRRGGRRCDWLPSRRPMPVLPKLFSGSVQRRGQILVRQGNTRRTQIGHRGCKGARISAYRKPCKFMGVVINGSHLLRLGATHAKWSTAFVETMGEISMASQGDLTRGQRTSVEAGGLFGAP